MIAIEISKPGGPDVLTPGERPVPSPAPNEVLIQVAAAGVNRPDLMQRAGRYPPPPGASDIPGLEVAGTIVAVGPDVRDWHVGDRVCALVSGGGYAEYCVAPAPQCLPVPRGFDFTPAAAIPETFFTVWSNVFERGRLQPGESILIHGGSSGIGTTAIQLARAWSSRVFVTAGSVEKCAACERLGAERAINYRETDFVAAIREATGGRGVDVVLDVVGGDVFTDSLRCLTEQGRLLVVGFASGQGIPAVKVNRLLLNNVDVRGVGWGGFAMTRSTYMQEQWDTLRPMIESGVVAPPIGATYDLGDFGRALQDMADRRTLGKSVVHVR
jgi:putative PIG3 family NAD(P)H quinone oxidoreductase